MKAVVFSEHGGPEVLQPADVETPEPLPGEVRVRVHASSVNHLDLWVRRGLPIRIPMPHIGGSDITGYVECLGPGVEGVELGTRVVVDPTLDWEWVEGVRRGQGLPEPTFRVLGEHTQGGFAEYAVVPVANLLRIPDDVSYETAAASGLVFVTAWRGLVSRGKVRPGHRVLITGASGGVSTAAVQLARRVGAYVYALTSGTENVRRVEELGAHVVMDRLDEDPTKLIQKAVGKSGVDLILDSVGAPLWEGLVRALRPGGRLVTYGATGGYDAPLDLRHVFWKQLSILGTTMGDPAEFRAAMELVFRGEVQPVIHSTVPLERLADAQRQLEEGKVFGKIVVTV